MSLALSACPRSAEPMPQIFRSASNTLAVVCIVGLPLGAAVLAATLWLYYRSPYRTLVGVPLPQPLPFSHAHHVRDLGIDCRYCHSTVETSAFAGMPATATCMHCHGQIWRDSPTL